MADFDFSVFTPATEAGTNDSALGDVLQSALRATGETDRWAVADEGLWCSLTPREYLQRGQGWKLHLSATVVSAEDVLARALPVLLHAQSAFKFASRVEHVARLNARHASRGHSGKFITIYPRTDEEAVQLAEALHQTTAGLPGPRILSDRPYAADSLVHYRYGAFVEQRVLSNDGLYSWVIFDPDGNPVEDRRVGQYLPPAWVSCPFPEPQGNAASGTKSRNGRVLLANRFEVREAIRHVNKGGVYRGVDTDNDIDNDTDNDTNRGAEAIIKEARPHVAADATGKDVRDLLRAEARALEALSPLGVAPRPLMLFEHSGHLFLAEEYVPGVPLRQWVLDQIRDGGWRRHVPQASAMLDRLVEIMDAAHRAGVVLRDFNPTNIMVLPDGQLRLIDLELAVIAGDTEGELTGAGTPGYGAPEQMKGAASAVEADYYSLGATLCFVIAGNAPYFLEDAPEGLRPHRERLAEWLAVRGAARAIAPEIQTLILGLMDDEPARRVTTSGARDVLATRRAQAPPLLSTDLPSTDLQNADLQGNDLRLTHEQWREAVDGIVGYLLAAMDPSHSERLWPASCAHGAPDPRTVQLGAAGVAGVLTRCYELTGDQRLPEAIATIGGWIARRLPEGEQRPPGLYFGETGIAWSLYEAGRTLGDEELTGRALALARGLPVSSPTPDVTHGTAGVGLAFLHLWLRTGDEMFAERAGQAADALIASASDEAGGLIWGTPAAFESRLAGGRYYGFAHGTAGVGYFLLTEALASGRTDGLRLAYRAGETLLDNATVGDGLALWGPGPGDAVTAPYWCHGSSGIGSFLTRLHAASGDDRFGKLADMAAQAVVENSWRGVLGQCHGLAGNGEFLLDMADMAGTGDMADRTGAADAQRYETLAHQHARILFASRAHRNGRVVFPDERGSVTASWSDGMSGILAFLLRLRHRSPRLWMVDSLLERSGHA